MGGACVCDDIKTIPTYDWSLRKCCARLMILMVESSGSSLLLWVHLIFVHLYLDLCLYS